MAIDLRGEISADTQGYIDKLHGKLNSLGADAQAAIKEETGIDTSNARVQQGAVSAVALAQNGYNPDNPEDSAKLIHAISGGLCLIPGVGVLLGGAVEGLWITGNAMAKPFGRALYQLGISGFDPDAPPRSSSGGWTVRHVLDANHLVVYPKGSFGAFAIAALTEYAALSSNLKGDVPPDVVIDAAIIIWNHTHEGPAVPYYIPAMGAQAGGLGVSPTEVILGSTFSATSGTTPAGKAGLAPNVFYAFQPASLGQKYSQVSNVADPKTWKFPFTVPYPLNTVGAVGVTPTEPRIALVNTGKAIPEPPTPKIDISAVTNRAAGAQLQLRAAIAQNKIRSTLAAKPKTSLWPYGLGLALLGGFLVLRKR